MIIKAAVLPLRLFGQVDEERRINQHGDASRRLDAASAVGSPADGATERGLLSAGGHELRRMGIDVGRGLTEHAPHNIIQGFPPALGPLQQPVGFRVEGECPPLHTTESK